jgi:DNA-binding XRE family transcriptional regulator
MTENERLALEKLPQHRRRQAILRQMSNILDKSAREEFSAKNSLTRFRRQVKLMRKKLGVNQATMAKLLEISRARYSQIESGSRDRDDINIGTARRIAALFDCTVTISLVSYLELIEGIADENITPVKPFGLEYSQSEYEIQSVDEWVRLGKQQEILRGKCLDDKMGVMRRLMERDRNSPPGDREFGNLDVNSLNIMQDEGEALDEREEESGSEEGN